MSKEMSRQGLIAEVMDAVAAFQDSTDEVDEAAAKALSVNRTDLRCMGVLSRQGPMSAGELAAACGLSPGAATTAIDRLVSAGLVRRRHDDVDRRRILVEPTTQAEARTQDIWGPIGEESRRRLSRRTTPELQAILDFLLEGQELQAKHASRISAPDLKRSRRRT